MPSPLPHATLTGQHLDGALGRCESLAALMDRPPPVDRRGKMRVIRRYGLLATAVLVLYWKVAWDVLLSGTIPMPELRLPRWRIMK